MKTLRRILLGFGALLLAIYVAACVYAYWPAAAEVPVSALVQPADRFVKVDGIALRYRAYGTPGPARPNILALHGFANSLQSFRELAPRLADCCYVVAIDLPGFGLSDKPATLDYHNRPQAERMVAAAKALGLTRPIYAGHSLGGAIALWAADIDPDAGGLVLMNPGILTTGVPKFAQITLPPLPRLAAKQFADREFRAQFLQKSYVNPAMITPQVIDDVMLGARSEGYLASASAMMTQYSDGEELPLLPRVRVPTLLLWGDRDRNKALSEANDLQRAMPGAELVRFGDAGHYVHEEAAAGCADALRSWAQRTAPSTN
jgi:pimeloyl-ACP methyl ester carboxylesterase